MIPELKLGVAVLMNGTVPGNVPGGARNKATYSATGGLSGPAINAALQATAVLVPPLTGLLNQVQERPALPPNPQDFVGTYNLLNDTLVPPIYRGMHNLLLVGIDVDETHL